MTEQQGEQPTQALTLTEDEAKKALSAWCRDNGYRLSYTERWVRWLDLPRPCWSTYALVENTSGHYYKELGVQVYEGGEVLAFPTAR